MAKKKKKKKSSSVGFSGPTKSVLTGSSDLPAGGQKVGLWVEPERCSVPSRQPKLCYFTVTVWVRAAAAAAQLAAKVKWNEGKLARVKWLSVKVGYRGVNPQEGSPCATAVCLLCVQGLHGRNS